MIDLAVLDRIQVAGTIFGSCSSEMDEEQHASRLAAGPQVISRNCLTRDKQFEKPSIRWYDSPCDEILRPTGDTQKLSINELAG